MLHNNELKYGIPILSNKDDNFIRSSYYGGATDYYKTYGENLYYYDVNSLYPYAMLNDMPLTIIKTYNHVQSQNIDLNSFFGFLHVEVKCPDNIINPLLPLHKDGKTIFPKGKWNGVYFSEEIKECMKYGYKFKVLKAIQFSREKIFNDYINYWYNIKCNSKGAQRFIAKLHLNTLYGYFGRRQEELETTVILKKDIKVYAMKYIIINISDVSKNDLIITYLRNNNRINSKLNIGLETTKFDLSTFSIIKSNVAIASAVTSYARIHMMQFKNNHDIFYTDTDSIITSKPLDKSLIGNKIGLMKDELSGGIISKAYFLGIKKYGYQCNDKDYSVISGVPRNSISFNEIKNIFMGTPLTVNIQSRFYKNNRELSISIKNTFITIDNKQNKNLIDNKYIAPVVNLNNNLFKMKYIKYLSYILNRIKITLNRIITP